MPRRWYRLVTEIYGQHLITYEHLLGHEMCKFVTVELNTEKEYSADMNLKVTRVNVTADQMTSAHVICFDDILIDNNLKK